MEYVLETQVHGRVRRFREGDSISFDAAGFSDPWVSGEDFAEAARTLESMELGYMTLGVTALDVKGLGGGWPKDWLVDRPVLLKANRGGTRIILLSPEAPQRAAFFIQGR